MIDRYTLVHGQPKPEPDLITWARWMESDRRNHRRVLFSTLGDWSVSTVFLGLDHSFNPDGPPILFETMLFQGRHCHRWADYQTRCGTLREARRMHRIAKLRLRNGHIHSETSQP